MDQIKLPEGFQPMATQVAGHTFQQDTEAVGLVQDQKSGCVLKPLGKPACGERELRFYETTTTTGDPLLAKARNFIPRFLGSRKLLVNERQHTFLQLEDLTHGMSKPCIMDVKIGKRTWDPQAPPQKRAVEEQKYVNCKQVLGLCVPGFQLYKANEEAVLRHGKDYGKQLDADGFRATIALFLNSYEPLAREILNQLQAIHDWFKVQTFFHFYASSLLIVYDFEAMQNHSKWLNARNGMLANGSNGQLNNAQNEKHTNTNSTTREPTLSPPPLPDIAQWVKVKMIDFAHVFTADGGSLDTNYIFGLQNFIAVIEELQVR